jgi:hypothetical protein
MTYAHPESGPNSPYTPDVNTPAVNPIPAERIPKPKAPRPAGVLAAVLASGIVIAVVAFALAGILLTVGLLVVPLLAFASIYYLVWSARREAPAREARRENPHDSVPSQSGVRGGSVQ